MTARLYGKLVVNTQLAVAGIQTNPAIQPYLAAYGYHLEEIAIGEALADELSTLIVEQAAVYGDQFAVAQEIGEAWATAKQAYTRTLKIARVAWADDVEATAALQLNGRRQVGLGAWLQQATLFYSNILANPRLLAELGGYGYTAAKLEGELGLVAAVRELKAVQEQKKGLARAATKARNVKAAALREWLSDLRKVAAVALADDPTLLIGLGFRPPRGR